MALMGGAMLIQGITPGPNVITSQPVAVLGIVVSMWVGNVMLLVINLPLIGLWVKLLAVPYRVLAPIDPRLLLHRRIQRAQHRLRCRAR